MCEKKRRVELKKVRREPGGDCVKVRLKEGERRRGNFVSPLV